MKNFKSIVLCVALITVCYACASNPAAAKSKTKKTVAAQKTPAAKKEVNAALQSATNFNDFIRITKLDLKVFYNNGQLQQEWFNALAKIAKKDEPSISNDQLKQKLRSNAITLLQMVRKNEQVNGISHMVDDAIGNKIDLPTTAKKPVASPTKTKTTKPIQERTVAPFTPILKELETIPMSESGYDETPTSFSSTVGIIPEPVVKTQKISLGAMELGQAKLPLSDDVTRFIEESKQQGINSKTMDQDWLLKAVQHILNGKLTRDNKAATLQKLFEVADAVVGVPLRADTTITDDEYDKIAGAMDRRINNFMSKLVVGSDYDLQWVK